jgi:hypothetical protein
MKLTTGTPTTAAPYVIEWRPRTCFGAVRKANPAGWPAAGVAGEGLDKQANRAKIKQRFFGARITGAWACFCALRLG